jgi:hypothetical protein
MMPPWVSALTAVVSLAMLAWEGRRYLLGKASLRWQRVQGTVVDLWFDVKKRRWVDDYPSVSTAVHLVYDYVVNGRQYRSRHFTYRPTRGLGEREAYALLEGLRCGQPVEVRYDAKRPQRAVLLPGTDSGNLVRLCFWAVAVCVLSWWLFAV